MNKTDRTKSLLKDTGWFAIGSFGSKILSLLLLPLYTNVLTTSEYGIIDIITTTISLCVPLLTLSVQDAAFRFALDKKEDKNAVFSNSMLIALVSPIWLLLALLIVGKIWPQTVSYLPYFFLIYIGNSINATIGYFLKGAGKTHIYATQGIIYTLFFASLNILFLVVLKVGIRGYLLSIVFADLCALLYMFFFGKLYTYVSVKAIKKTTLVRILKYCSPLIMASIAWWVMTSIDKYMILYMVGSDANGLYSVAHKIPSIITLCTTFFLNAWQISAVKIREEEDSPEYVSGLYNLLTVVGAVMSMALILGSRLIGRIMFAGDFFAAWTMMPCLVAATTLSVYSGFLGAQFTAFKRSDLHLKSNLLSMAANVILNLILIYFCGAIGACYGTMISYFISLVYRHRKVKELCDLKYKKSKLYTILFIMMFAAVVTSFGLYYLIIDVIAFAAVLLVLRKDIAEILTHIKNLIFQVMNIKKRTGQN